MSARAGIVVTGTEVLSGRVRDRNGPWLADRLTEIGVELAHLTICGDRPEDMVAQLDFMRAQGVDLVVTSGGLGPTADDLTIEVVARWSGRRLTLDEALEERIAAILARLSRRWRTIDPEALRAANRKQAMVPEGAEVIEPAGTAPGVVVPGVDGASPAPAVVVLPGPPRELHAMWHAAVETEPFRAAVAGATRYSQRMLRLFGIPESELAATLREAEETIEGFGNLEITTCLRRGEVEAVIRFDPSGEPASDALAELVAARHERTLFSTDGSSVDDQVAALLVEGGHRVGVGESCTGGLMAARLTERAGASTYVAGGVTAYSNEAKSALLGVDPALIERCGAVSPEVARAMAEGALARFEADLGLAITGVAGPGGGSDAKPVGYVCWCVLGSDGRIIARDVQIPGDRAEIRDRSTTVGMHLLRRLLRGEEAPI